MAASEENAANLAAPNRNVKPDSQAIKIARGPEEKMNSLT
jgi:hypothetical protein